MISISGLDTVWEELAPTIKHAQAHRPNGVADAVCPTEHVQLKYTDRVDAIRRTNEEVG